MNKKSNYFLFVLYDSIENSVFSGQVLTLIRKKIQTGKHVLLVSFEKKQPTTKQVTQLIPQIDGLETIFLKKFPFVGKASLLPAIYQLKKVLRALENYEIIARGPHAGYLCLNAVDFTKCSSLNIQARGLIAQEYSYTHQSTQGLAKMLHTIRTWQCEALEKTVYGNAHQFPNTRLETVSHALKTYLVKHFGAVEQIITIATEDIPQRFKPSRVAQWRLRVRKQLGIPSNATVFCYNGSIKPWQCPNMVIEFFVKKQQNTPQAFLLILTQNKHQFENLIKASNIAHSTYSVQTVHHTKIYQYLSASDYGLLFRENNVVNWVSRPTKALEYEAVGLEIIHNNTVDWIQRKKGSL